MRQARYCLGGGERKRWRAACVRSGGSSPRILPQRQAATAATRSPTTSSPPHDRQRPCLRRHFGRRRRLRVASLMERLMAERNFCGPACIQPTDRVPTPLLPARSSLGRRGVAPEKESKHEEQHRICPLSSWPSVWRLPSLTPRTPPKQGAYKTTFCSTRRLREEVLSLADAVPQSKYVAPGAWRPLISEAYLTSLSYYA